MSAVIRRAGHCGLLVEVDDLAGVLQVNELVAGLRHEAPWNQLVDVVPAATTVLLTTRDATALTEVRHSLARLLAAHSFASELVPGSGARHGDKVFEVPVRYDGPDLDEVGRITGLSRSEVVAAHTGTPWRVAFCGFAPGFPYMVDGDPRLEVPRRKEPRTVVPPGAVGLAGKFSGIYPRESPGGWQLLGTTTLRLWDTDRESPALLQPGMLVRFVEEG